jgi:hypothetical protein
MSGSARNEKPSQFGLKINNPSSFASSPTPVDNALAAVVGRDFLPELVVGACMALDRKI